VVLRVATAVATAIEEGCDTPAIEDGCDTSAIEEGCDTSAIEDGCDTPAIEGGGLGSGDLRSEVPDPPGGWPNPWLPGAVHEQAVSGEDRTARGAWYTPEPVVRGLVALATANERPPSFVADPTCGGGAFLLAALDRLVELGVEPGDAVGRVAGLDIDPGAVAVSRLSVALWAAINGLSVAADEVDVVQGDALAGYPAHWPAAGLLVGNPPFATPLRTGAVPPEVEAFRTGREDLLGPYTDLAAMHLLAAVESRQPGSVVALVQPQSVLSGRDTGALRDHLDRVAPVHGLWAARESVFDAGVRACAAVVRPGAEQPETVALASGPAVEPAGREQASAGSWARYAARALGAPVLPPSLSGHDGTDSETLGGLATATAGFRDEYYGLAAACTEWNGRSGVEPNRLVTVGAVEPLACKWGTDSSRFARQKWLRPCIDVERLDPKVAGWVDRQLRPKVVLATQSPILEPLLDRSGRLVPATPLIAVHGSQQDLPRIAAVLLAPPVVAWAWQRWFGAALAVDALKLAARQVLELPLPVDRILWNEAAEMIEAECSDADRADSLVHGWAVACRVAELMNRAYRADDAVLDWWYRRSARPRR
jgi:hypothetical protein